MSNPSPKLRFHLLLSISLVLTSCDSSSNVEKEISKWEAQGWRFTESVGTPVPDAVAMSWAKSEPADEIVARSHLNSEGAKSRTYRQIDSTFLIVQMGHEAHGNFALVFSKPKSPADH